MASMAHDRTSGEFVALVEKSSSSTPPPLVNHVSSRMLQLVPLAARVTSSLSGYLSHIAASLRSLSVFFLTTLSQLNLAARSPTTLIKRKHMKHPKMFKFIVNYLICIHKLAAWAAHIRLGDEATNLRTLIDWPVVLKAYLTSSAKKQRRNKFVDRIDTQIASVKCRVYKPSAAAAAQHHQSQFIIQTPPSRPLVDQNNNNTNTENTNKKRSLMIYYHGGSFHTGNLDASDEFLEGFVTQLNMIVVSVDYKLAPEHPHPNSVNDCYRVTRDLLDSATGACDSLGADVSRIVLAGNSAGGNLACVVSHRLAEEYAKSSTCATLHRAKLQLLIYPWMQMVHMHLPSMLNFRANKLSSYKFISWYLGVTDRHLRHQFESTLTSLERMQRLLDADEHLRRHNHHELFRSSPHFDIQRIPVEYKDGKDYYDASFVDLVKAQQHTFLTTTSTSTIADEEDNEVKKQQHKSQQRVAELVRRLFEPDVSPLLVESCTLQHVPPTYLVSVEWDPLKDEGLLYAERLRECGVECTVAFYENAFHSQATLTSSFPIARQIQNEIVQYMAEHV